jgi:hypothetical protein
MMETTVTDVSIVGDKVVKSAATWVECRTRRLCVGMMENCTSQGRTRMGVLRSNLCRCFLDQEDDELRIYHEQESNQ